MPTAQRTELDISTLLDPRFKNYKFPGLPLTLDLSDEKNVAMDLRAPKPRSQNSLI